ncbi:MAG: peptidyl-prolyl cis-trans isomerase [Muricomes sp.]
MGQFRKRLVMMAAAGVFAVSSLMGCSSRSIDSSAVVAQVGDEKIPLGVANFYARLQQAQTESYYMSLLNMSGDDMWTQDMGDGKTYEETTKENILKSLEDLYLLKQNMGTYGVELTKEDEKAIDDAAALFVKDNSDKGKEAVSGEEQYVKTFLELITIQSKMDGPMKEGVNEEVSDDEAAQKSMEYVFLSYTKNTDDGSTEQMSDDEKASLKETAQKIADRLNNGETVDAAATAEGQKMLTATFDSSSTSPSQDLVKAADALGAEGDVTGVVETDNGLYVAKLISMMDREATDSKKVSIVNERKQTQYDSLLEQWRKDTEIKEHKDVWKQVSFADQGISIKQTTQETTGGDSSESNK